MKISDELREWADVHCGDECGEYLGLLADRIDREMVELPHDKEGAQIHVGDTVWGCVSGMKLVINELRLTSRWTMTANGGFAPQPLGVTHIRPDSLDRIADDIEARLGTGVIDGSTLCKWVERISKFAKEDE